MVSLSSCLACIVMSQAAAAPAAALPSAAPAYVSPFGDYRRFEAPLAPKPWRQANDEVRDAGGHIGIVKGMSRPAAATAAGKSPSGGEGAKPAQKPATKPAAPPAPAGHDHGAHR